MANTTSKINIINLALANIGQDTITSADQDSATARTSNLMYDVVRRNLLRAHDWTFALRWADLTASTVESPYDHLPYVYAQPSDCLFIKRITYSGTAPHVKLPNYQLFTSSNANKLIATPLDGARAFYVRDEQNETLFDDLFVACFADLLAAELAVPLAGDSQLAAQMYQKYAEQLRQARITNKVEQPERPLPTSEFLEAR